VVDLYRSDVVNIVGLSTVMPRPPSLSDGMFEFEVFKTVHSPWAGRTSQQKITAMTNKILFLMTGSF